MQCSRCSHETPPRAKFCPECGAPVPAACAKCTTPLPAGAKFCPECAHPAAAPLATAAGTAARFASPASYTPKHLAEKILTSKEALLGERKHVTVLFADLKGSMELLADRDPEDARAVLDTVLQRMMDAVHQYEGTVNQVMGDGIMALFGAPLALEDHAVRAAYAALKMQAAVQQYAEEVHRSIGVPLHIRVGLNSGEVVVRSIGNDLHMDYTAVGQTTHLAARMEQMAMPGSILIPPETLALVEGYVVVKALGPRPVKGVEAPLEVFEVTGASPIRSRLHAAASRGLTRFVGRDSEIDQLARALARARTGQGQIVAVVGEPGVGKSRLYWEFLHSHHVGGWLIMESTSASYGKASALLPVIELLKGYFKVEDHDDARAIREKVTGKLLALDESLRGVLFPLVSALGAPTSDAQWEALGAAERRQRILDAVKRLILRESQAQPVIVVFEDLHWIDDETQTLLDSFVESLPSARVLLLVNYRPEYRHGWGSRSYYTQLRIDPLASQNAAALLDALMGDAAPLQPLKRLLIARTEGNPFFLEESVRTLVETRVVVGAAGAYELVKSVDTIQVPATVQAVLAARIDRLPLPVKHLLQSAAVIGKEVPLPLLEAVSDSSVVDLRRELTQLQAAEFLYETSLFPEVEYTFKHALTLEVAYQSLLRERRRTLHERVLETLESRRGSGGQENIELLAHHALRGDVWPRAAMYLFRAGARAQAEARYAAATAFYIASLEALQRLGAAADRGLELDVHLELWSTRISTGQVADMNELGAKVEALARALDDGPRLARVQVRQAQAIAFTAAITGTLDSAIERAREASRRADPTDVRTRSYAQFIAGVACRDLGRVEAALAEFDAGIRLFSADALSGHEPGLVYPIYVSLCGWRAEAHAALGHLDAALASAHDALRVAGDIKHPSSVSIANAFLGYVHVVRGAVDDAVPILERGLAISEEHELVHGICANGLYLAWALLLSGRRAAGLDALARGLARPPGALLQWTRFHTVTAMVHLIAGQAPAARVEIARGLTASAERDARGYRAPLLRLDAQILATEGDLDAARARAHEALAVALELGTRPELAHCHATLAYIAGQAGDTATAATHHATATATFSDLGMSLWSAWRTS
jgi:class 3 adenylate cyclase/tetratricopeptide (TPR) repeat protein